MVSVASSSTSRTPLVEPEQTSSEKPLSSSTQPFTDVLTEATSKVLQDGLDKPEALSKLSQKGESTKAVPFKNAKEERSGSSPKKSVPIDISTQLVPIIVPQVPLVITETAPTAALAIAPIVKEPVQKQANFDAVTTIDAQDSKSSATILNVDAVIHQGVERVVRKEPESGGLAPAVSPKSVATEVPVAKEMTSVESAKVEFAQAVESPDKSTTLTKRSTSPAGDKSDIAVGAPALVSDLVVAPEVRTASLTTTGFTEEPKLMPAHAPSIRVASKPTAPVSEPVSEHVSSSRISTQPDVVPVSPTQPSVVVSAVNTPSVAVSGVNTIPASAHITQPSLHPLDVGALVGAISRPLVEAREGYTVMIAMHPVELGRLQAVVTLHGSDLHVLITPQTQVGHDALTSAVDTLKTELSRGGVNVNVTLQDPGSQSRGGDRPQATSAPREVFAQEESIVTASAAPALSANQINLVL